jgi:drug/metabolite transporter (DMT)-like permease
VAHTVPSRGAHRALALRAMLAPAVLFVQVILALHILSVVAAFGVLFAYPIFMTIGAQLDPHAMPWFHRMQQAVSRWLIGPGLLLVVIFGAILASKDHAWHAFYVQWGIGAALVMGALEGMFMIPREGRLAELARRDLEAAAGRDGGGQGVAVVTHSPEYETVFRQVSLGGMALSVIVILTIYFMATQAGA